VAKFGIHECLVWCKFGKFDKFGKFGKFGEGKHFCTCLPNLHEYWQICKSLSKDTFS